jgi:hypothetical protein
MNSRRRLLTYLLINIFVSALVTGTVIFFYDRAHRAACIPALPNSASITPDENSVNATIVGVIGAGAITDERMVIQNNGSGELLLDGWYLIDNKGVTYTFPQLTLYPGGKVQLHTTAGKDTPTDLFWGRSSPVWTSGELAALYDAHAIARAFYRVP